VEPKHRRNFTTEDKPSRPAKGGEPVPRLFALNTAGALRRNEDGQTMAEYGVVLSVITVAVIAAISLLSTSVQDAVKTVAGLIPG
jgi:Flp pilus assembly pilin Flp